MRKQRAVPSKHLTVLWHMNAVFSFLVPTDVTNLFRTYFRKPCADEKVASASACVHTSLPQASAKHSCIYLSYWYVNLSQYDLCIYIYILLNRKYIVFVYSFYDASAKLSFRDASTSFRACSQTHKLTLLWILMTRLILPKTNDNKQLSYIRYCELSILVPFCFKTLFLNYSAWIDLNFQKMTARGSCMGYMLSTLLLESFIWDPCWQTALKQRRQSLWTRSSRLPSSASCWPDDQRKFISISRREYLDLFATVCFSKHSPLSNCSCTDVRMVSNCSHAHWSSVWSLNELDLLNLKDR